MSNLEQPENSWHTQGDAEPIMANRTPGIGSARRRLTVVAVSVAHGLSHLNSQGISVLYPVLREYFGFGYTGIALLSVVNQVVEGPMQITFGVITRFLRRVHILGIGTALSFIGVTGLAVSQSYSHLLASKAIRGLGTSPNHPVGGAFMADSFPKARSRALAIYQTSGNIGGWAAPVVVGSLIYFFDWRLVIFILGLPLLLASLVFFSFKGPAPQADIGSTGRRRERLGLSEYKAVIRDRNALLVALVMMVGAAGRGTGALGIYLTAIVVDRYGVSVPFAATFFAAYMLGGVVGPITLGWFADRTSPRLALRITLVFSAVFAVLFLMPQTPGIFLGAVTFLAGFFIHSRGSLTQSILVNLGLKDVRVDTLLSLYHTMSAISGPGWIFVTGVLVDRFGIAVALIAMASSYIVGMAVLNFVKFKPTYDKP
jgi:MFS family permease